MMSSRPPSLRPWLGVIALAVAACADTEAPTDPPTAVHAPLATLTSDQGHYQVSLATPSGAPLVPGNDTVEFLVADAQGQPQDGLSLAVVPWMPAMKHGTSVQPTVTAEGQGKYLVTNVILFMPGTWELRTTITGSAVDTLAPSFAVE